MKEHFSPVGEYKKWLLADRIAPWTAHITADEKDIFENITMSNGGFDGPVKSYKSLMRDYNAADEKGKQSQDKLNTVNSYCASHSTIEDRNCPACLASHR